MLQPDSVVTFVLAVHASYHSCLPGSGIARFLAHHHTQHSSWQGMSTVRLLKQLEERTGRRIHELFDLVAGTSTGGILAVAVALKRFTLSECEDIYRCAASPLVH